MQRNPLPPDPLVRCLCVRASAHGSCTLVFGDHQNTGVVEFCGDRIATIRKRWIAIFEHCTSKISSLFTSNPVYGSKQDF